MSRVDVESWEDPKPGREVDTLDETAGLVVEAVSGRRPIHPET